jgi:hypothetical protein
MSSRKEEEAKPNEGGKIVKVNTKGPRGLRLIVTILIPPNGGPGEVTKVENEKPDQKNDK